MWVVCLPGRLGAEKAQQSTIKRKGLRGIHCDPLIKRKGLRGTHRDPLNVPIVRPNMIRDGERWRERLLRDESVPH
jgi:hypothetical protein